MGINTTATAEALTINGNLSFLRGSNRMIGIPAANAFGTSLTIQAGGNLSSHGNPRSGGELILKAGDANISSAQVCNDDYLFGPYSNNVKIYAGDNVFSGNCGTKRNGNIILYAGHNQPERLRVVGNNGFVGIGTTQPQYKLHVNGRVAGVGSFANLSDIRFKKEIKPISNALSKINALQGVSYDWRKKQYPEIRFGDQRQIGFLAQEVAKIIPEAVSIDENGIHSISYSMVTPVLVEAIKDQQATIEKLKKDQSELLKRLERLEKRPN